MRKPLVIDFETQKTFREVQDPRDLLISLAGVYDYNTDQYRTFEESELGEMIKLFEDASIIVGFNIDHFDMPVLQPYYPGSITQFKTFDILADIKNIIGRRLSLDDLVQATLGEGKSGHGLQAIRFFREGKMDELRKYCLDDVRLTKELFEYGVQQGKIYYPDNFGDGEKRTIHVKWESYMEYKGDQDNVNLTLPF
jgi:DEAD/DEAH box helicase domain-containing protein